MNHYLSNDHAANHLFAGIEGMGDLGILSGTFGAVKFIEDPADGDGNRSGLGIVSRVDYGFSWPAYYIQFFMDINVT